MASADNVKETTLEDGTTTYPSIMGVNAILQSSFLRMTLVATSTVVLVTAIALFGIGIGEMVVPNYPENKGTESVVLAVGGALLLATAIVQFLSVCVWSGWCSLLPSDGFRLLEQNQILVNGQLITVHQMQCGTTGCETSKTRGGIPFEEKQPILGSSVVPTSRADASTSTRGELLYLTPRNHAPIAVQEEITPSLRSSFQSFDDIK